MLPKKQTYTDDGKKSSNQSTFVKDDTKSFSNGDKPKPQTAERTKTEPPKAEPKGALQSLSDQGKQNQQYWVNQHQGKLVRNEANKILNANTADRENRIKENPDYVFDLYEFTDQNGNTVSGRDYKAQIDDYNSQVTNWQNSMSNLENTYYKDKDYAKYENGFNELSKEGERLMAIAKELDSYNAQYNESASKEYEENKKTMVQILNVINSMAQNGASQADIDALNQEYIRISKRNEELETIVKDIDSMKESQVYEFLKENGDEESIRNYESYISATDDSVLKRIARKSIMQITTPAYDVLGLANMAKDLVGEAAGNVLDAVAESMHEKGTIDDEDFNKLSDYSKKLKEYEVFNNNTWSQQLRDFRGRIDAEVKAGDLTPDEEYAVDIMSSALENGLRRSIVGKWSVATMGIAELLDVYAQDRQMGYTVNTSLSDAFAKGAITAITENLATERYLDLLGTTVGMGFDQLFVSTLAENMVKMVPEEMLEEGAEYILNYFADYLKSVNEPLYDDFGNQINVPEFRPGDLYRNMIVAGGSSAVSAVFGATASAFNYEMAIPEIKTIEEYNQLSTEIDKSKILVSYESDLEKKLNLQRLINQAERRKREFEAKSATAGKIELESDKAVDVTPEQTNRIYKEALVPEAMSESAEQEKKDIEFKESNEILRTLTQEVLTSKGIIMPYQQYIDLDNDTRNIVNRVSETFNNVAGNKVQLAFSTSVAPGGSIRETENGVRITVNPYSKTMIQDIFKHEIIHLLKETSLWDELVQRTEKGLGKRKKTAEAQLSNIGYDDNVIAEELVAYFNQGEYDVEKFLTAIGKKDRSFLRRVGNMVNDLVGRIGKQSEADILARKVASAFESIKSDPKLTSQTAMANNDADGIRGKDTRDLRTVQDIDSVHKDLAGYDGSDEYLREKGVYDESFGGAFNGYFSESARGTVSKSAVYDDDYVVLNGQTVAYTKETLDRIFEDAEKIQKYGGNVALTYMNPRQFIYLTAQGYSWEDDGLFLDWLAEDTRKRFEELDINKAQARYQKKSNGLGDGPAYLYIIKNKDGTLRVSSHEGRHTQWAFVDNGVDMMPVEIRYGSNITIDDLQNARVMVQDNIGRGKIYYEDRGTTIGECIEVNEENKDLIYDTFGPNADAGVFLNKDISMSPAEAELDEFLQKKEIIDAFDLLDGYSGIYTQKKNLDNSLEKPARTRNEVLRENIENLKEAFEDDLETYMEDWGHTIDDMDWEEFENFLTDPFAMESGPREEMSLDDTYELARLEVEYLKELHHINQNKENAILHNKDFDINGLNGKLSALDGVQFDEETSKLINTIEEQITFGGGITDQMKDLLGNMLYDSRKYMEEGYNEVTKKQINKWLRENPLKWSTVKGDNRLGLIEFQKEHPGFKFARDGGRDWDVIAKQFEEDFPGTIDASSVNSAVDFINAVQEYRDQVDEANQAKMVDPHDEETFFPMYEKIIDEFVKVNQPKVKPKQLSQSTLDAIERNRQAFRDSVEDWVQDYDVLRRKYDSFDEKAFKDAIADVYVIGEVSDQTREELFNSLTQNDFMGEFTGGKANQYINDFIDNAVEMYILEADYNANKRYRDKIAKNANIVNQAMKRSYEEDYDRSEEAMAINEMAKSNRLRDSSAIEEDVDNIILNNTNKKNPLYNRDLKEYNDLIAGGNMATRERLYNLIEEPIQQAQARELKTLMEYKKELEDLQKEVGIKKYSKEDEAVGWIIEGHTQIGEPYSLDELKKDFPKKWKDILKLADYYTKTVKKWYEEEIALAEEIYGDVEYNNELRTAKLEAEVESARAILAKRNADLRKNANPKTQAGYSKAKKALESAERRYKAQLKKNEEHADTRRQFTPYRQNYFHHTDEVHFGANARAFFEMVSKGIRRENKVPSEIAGMTEYTEPKSTIQSYKWKQGKRNYSSSGFASLEHRLQEHANAMAFDPTIAYLRTVESTFRELDAENEANNYLTWLTKYINNLAGKSNDLDRVIRDMTPDETMGFLKTLNDRAQKNAVFGNLSSALVQTGNIPVGMGLLAKNGGKQAVQDLVKGSAYYVADMKNKTKLKDQSTFLNMRYFDIDIKDARWSSKMDDVGNFLMTVLDKVSAEEMWYTFYAQGERLKVKDPVKYADEMTDRSTQSRRPEDMPLSQQSQIIRLIAPFQVEVNNQWQVMKDMVKGSVTGDKKLANATGLATMMVVSAVMSAMFRKILNRDPLFNPIGAIMDAIGDGNVTEDEIVGRILGEILGAIPGGQYVPSLLGLDEKQTEAIFGDSDPSRYGIGNIGLSAIAKLLTAQTPEDRQKALEEVIFTYGPNGWGKQGLRFYRTGQDFGLAPKFVNGEWRMDPIHYTSTGGVGFINDPKNYFDYFRDFMGGSYNTTAGKDYVNSGYSKAGAESVKDDNGNIIKGSKAMMVRKELEDAGVYESVVKQIEKGQMSLKQAGLTEAVMKMSQEEFDQKYKDLMVQAEGIGNALSKAYGWDDDKYDSFQKAVELEADYKDGRKVTDSEALKTRKALEDAGIYDEVIEYLEKNNMEYSSVGLGKRVVGYDEDKFLKAYASKIGK